MSIDFIEFYGRHNISPVAQDVSNLEVHFSKRRALLISLGIMPMSIEDSSILEFGPGSGHNALYLASLGPSKFDLVEGNPTGFNRTKELLSKSANTEVIHCLFQEFESKEKYDLVWAEGCIPHNRNVNHLLNKVAEHTKSGGLLCVSTISGLSWLSEIFRRLIFLKFFKPKCEGIHISPEVRDFYSKQLLNLKGMSRPIDDWLLDNILQPLQERELLSFVDVINSIGNRFQVIGTSPKFLIDWRWYKEIPADPLTYNEYALASYYTTNINQLDYRYVLPSHSLETGYTLESIGARAWVYMCQIESGETESWDLFFSLIDELIEILRQINSPTLVAIEEACGVLKEEINLENISEFSQWWGRGQQYVSLLRE
jgi:SAM-dependent methyltransferase